MGYLLGGNASGVTHGGGLLLPTTHLSQTGRSCRSGKDLCEYAKRHQAKLITSADAGTSYRPDLRASPKPSPYRKQKKQEAYKSPHNTNDRDQSHNHEKLPNKTKEDQK